MGAEARMPGGGWRVAGSQRNVRWGGVGQTVEPMVVWKESGDDGAYGWQGVVGEQGWGGQMAGVRWADSKGEVDGWQGSGNRRMLGELKGEAI